MNTVLVAAQSEEARMIAGPIGANPATSARLDVNLTIAGTGPNSLLRGANLACVVGAAHKALDQLVNAHGPVGIDVLAGLTVMAEHLHGLHATTTDVVLLGNLVSTTGPLKITNADLADPDGTVARILAKGLFRDCAGWQVYAIGGGSGTSLDDEQQAALRELYRDLFASCGGKLVDWDSDLVQFPDPGGSVPPLFTTPPPPHHTRAGIVLTLPATEFNTGSAVLRPGATQVLATDLSIIERYPNARLTITGYSDSTPDLAPGGNVGLSLDRAIAVADWLERTIDPSRIAVSGAGPTNFIAPNTTPQGREANRRVEIIIHTG